MPEKAPAQSVNKEAQAAARQQVRQLARTQAAQLQAVGAGAGTIQLYRPDFSQVNELFFVRIPKRVDTVVARFLRPSLNFDHFIFDWHGQEIELPEANILGPRPSASLRPSAFQPAVTDDSSNESEEDLAPMDDQQEETSSFAPSFSFAAQSSATLSPPQTSSSLFAPQTSSLLAPQPTSLFPPQPSSLFPPQPSSLFPPQPSSLFPPQPSSLFAPQPSSLFAPQTSSPLSPSSLAPPQPSFGASLFSFSSPSAFSTPQTSTFASSAPSLSASSQQQTRHEVISGHGRFNERYLLDDPKKRRAKKATFTVPPNITVIMYAPNGAALDNPVANAIEQGNYPAADQLELKHEGGKVTPVPTPYPYVFGPGTEAINYTVSRPDRLSIKGSPILVREPTSLFDLVSGIQGNAIVHYACCSAGSSDKVEFRDLFPNKGSYVRFQ